MCATLKEMIQFKSDPLRTEAGISIVGIDSEVIDLNCSNISDIQSAIGFFVFLMYVNLDLHSEKRSLPGRGSAEVLIQVLIGCKGHLT